MRPVTVSPLPDPDTIRNETFLVDFLVGFLNKSLGGEFFVISLQDKWTLRGLTEGDNGEKKL